MPRSQSCGRRRLPRGPGLVARDDVADHRRDEHADHQEDKGHEPDAPDHALRVLGNAVSMWVRVLVDFLHDAAFSPGWGTGHPPDSTVPACSARTREA